MRRALAITFGALLAAAPAAAQTPAAAPHDLRFSWKGDGGATAALGVLWIGSELEKKHLAPVACRWCDTVPGIDRTARDRWKWKLFLSKARTKTERILFQSKPGNKRQADQSSLQREFASGKRRK